MKRILLACLVLLALASLGTEIPLSSQSFFTFSTRFMGSHPFGDILPENICQYPLDYPKIFGYDKDTA